MKQIVVLLSLCFVAPFTCLAADSPDKAGTQAAGYTPGLGDLMTASVQPRHTKLGLAGQAGNWAYASYEFGELKEALDEVADLLPTWEGKPIATMLHSITEKPLQMLDAAIQAKDGRAFNKAYASLTAACNLCHTNAGKPMIVIQVPATSFYPDQNFKPDQNLKPLGK
jgi:hypothetical protein